ncbi:MAG: hypothetical protein ABSD80_00315 [Caulobacteraceae bacterium]|jgi:hypothetical protein
MDQFDVSAVVGGVDRPSEIEHMLAQLGARPRVFKHRDLTIFVNQERALSASCAMAAFLRKLECLRVKFDYIAVGDARDAIVGYEAALAGLDGLSQRAA